jgi:hypothetical protein
MKVSELEWLVGFIERKSIESKRFDVQSLTLSSKNKDFLFDIKEKLGLSVNPYLNGNKTAYEIKFANYADSEIIYSIFHHNIVTERFLQIFNVFEQKFDFVNILSTISNIKPNINDGWLSGVIDARTSFAFDDFSPIVIIRSHVEFDNFIKSIFPEINFNNKKKIIQGIAIKPIINYLNNFNPKLQAKTFL